MRIAILVPDNREIDRNYSPTFPYFGTAPTGFFAGFVSLAQGAASAENGILEIECVGAGCPNSESPSPISIFKTLPRSGSETSPQTQPAFEIHVISCTQRPMKSPEKLADNIWFHSLHVSKWGWLKTGYLGCILAARRKLKEIQPDLVHAQGTERDSAMSAVFSGYPKLLTIHGNLRLIKKTVGFKPFSVLWFQTFLEGIVVPLFDGVVCITNYTKQAVEHETPKTWVIPNAVDPAFLTLGEEREARRLKFEEEEADSSVQPSLVRHSPGDGGSFNIQHPKNPPIILVVANVDARKNQNEFIRALDSLADFLPFLVKFFGKCSDDGYGKEFKQLVSERNWCHFGGMINRDQLRSEFESAAILALPTHEDNCPMVILEAQAAGIPVLASNVGGIPDLVEDRVTGLLMDPNDPLTIQAGIKSLLEGSSLVRKLTTDGLTQARSRFSPAVIAAAHLEVYSEVIAKYR